MLVHATAITNLTDARYFAAKEVANLGFFLEDGAVGYLDPSWMKAIIEWVQGPVLTGWFMQSTLEVVSESAHFYGLESVVVSAHMLQRSTDQTALDGLSWSVVIAPENGLFNDGFLDALATQPEQVILDLRGGIGVQPEAEMIVDICRRRHTLLYIDDLDVTTLEHWLAAGAAGFCVSGSAEERVGVKQYDDLEDFFDWMEERMEG